METPWNNTDSLRVIVLFEISLIKIIKPDSSMQTMLRFYYDIMTFIALVIKYLSSFSILFIRVNFNNIVV
jgi:hypothetical protein